MRAIYLDYMATTPVAPEVIETMHQYLGVDNHFGNPSSNHWHGLAPAKAIDTAREQVASLINASSEEIVFTSGATEADNLAIKGAALFYQRKGKHLITATTEHSAVLDSFKALEGQGFDVTYLKPDTDGLISPKLVESHCRDDTVLVSIMHVNNEIGVIQPIAEISQVVKARGAIFHVDAAQSAGKVPIDVHALGVDLMAFSGHKVYGPKGIGALYVKRRPRIRLVPQIDGGGHEHGLRSGTLATHLIAGLGEAFRLAKEKLGEDNAHISQLRERFLQGIAKLPGIHLNGSDSRRVPHNLNLSIEGVDGESLLYALSELSISTSSACHAASLAPSHVLLAIGLPELLALSSIRLSFGRPTTVAEVDKAVNLICREVTRLREMAP